MATDSQIKTFIGEIGPLIQKYAKEFGYKVASPIIAQACCESAFGTSSLGYKYHNYFGMKCGGSWKGKSVNLKTKEEYTVGTLTNITANFRAYDSMEEGVKGYFQFISAARYANLKTAKTPTEYLNLIKSDGYATSSTYVQTNMNIVNKYDLTRFDGDIMPASKPMVCEWFDKEYVNGSTPEAVYSDTECKNKIGSLNPREKCKCLGKVGDRAIVFYATDNNAGYKVGFVKWLGGIKK